MAFLTMLQSATGRNPRQRFWLVFAGPAPIRFATDCHRLQPRGSIRAPSDVASSGYWAVQGCRRVATAGLHGTAGGDGSGAARRGTGLASVRERVRPGGAAAHSRSTPLAPTAPGWMGTHSMQTVRDCKRPRARPSRQSSAQSRGARAARHAEGREVAQFASRSTSACGFSFSLLGVRPFRELLDHLRIERGNVVRPAPRYEPGDDAEFRVDFHHPFLRLQRSHACRRSSRPRDAQSRAWGRLSRRLCAPLATTRNPAPLVRDEGE
jgi:hypothetical protein